MILRYYGYGYTGICVDDGINLTYAEQVASICDEFGFKMTFLVSQQQVEQQSNYISRLQALINSGHDIVCHGYSDTDLTKLYAIDVDGASASSTIEVSGDSIYLDNDGNGTPDHTFAIGTDGTTVISLVNWINTFSAEGWSARKLGGSATDIDSYAKLSGLQEIKTTITVS